MVNPHHILVRELPFELWEDRKRILASEQVVLLSADDLGRAAGLAKNINGIAYILLLASGALRGVPPQRRGPFPSDRSRKSILCRCRSRRWDLRPKPVDVLSHIPLLRPGHGSSRRFPLERSVDARGAANPGKGPPDANPPDQFDRRPHAALDAGGIGPVRMAGPGACPASCWWDLTGSLLPLTPAAWTGPWKPDGTETNRRVAPRATRKWAVTGRSRTASSPRPDLANYWVPGSLPKRRCVLSTAD